MFAKILIANRGEIACRVMRTARRLGIRTVAVYSDADAHAWHVELADEALRIGPAPVAESYLDIEAVLAAARASGAEAIHPGYGFLSENFHFAAACEKAGIAFIGPSAKAIAAMGDKSAAKRLMEKAGVPLVPGYHGERQKAAFLEGEAARIGFPVLIKPSSGGGGKGMRIVEHARSFGIMLEAARREARSAFGDDRVLIERYLERPRHIEVQVFGDSHGNAVHLFERDCSVQRRHQKVIEEAPAPGMIERRRSEMGAAALAAAQAIGYTNAGTVEFIVDADGRFYFMEMNTRLQVEHPVTEMITGLDLVEWQIRVAAGERLPLAQESLRFSGHAIEARIYAEDPQRDFLPSTGTLAHLVFPETSEAVRVDTGVAQGDAITPWYDPMIAKLIVHGTDRTQALARLARALEDVEIAGVTTNVQLLHRIASSPAFAAEAADTGFIERHRLELLAEDPAIGSDLLAAAACAELAEEERRLREQAERSGDRYSPWHGVDGWRLNQAPDRAIGFERISASKLRVRIEDRVFTVSAVRCGGEWHLFRAGEHRRLAARSTLQDAERDAHAGSLAAPMPGKIVQILAQAGEPVKKGQALLVLEAMKMEHTITAPSDGVVKAVHYAVGEQVMEGVELIALG